MSDESLRIKAMDALCKKHSPVVSAQRCDDGILIERATHWTPSGPMTEQVFVSDAELEKLIADADIYPV